MWWTHLTDEKERARGPPGTNFSSVFGRPVHYCKQVRTILHSPPTSFAAIFSHSLSLSSWNTTVCHPDFPQCTTAKPRLVAVCSPRFQSCRRSLECFPSPSIFHLSCSESENKPDILVLVFFFFFFLGDAYGLRQIQVGTGKESMSETKAEIQPAFEEC